jgi:hypothetical protein
MVKQPSGGVLFTLVLIWNPALLEMSGGAWRALLNI